MVVVTVVGAAPIVDTVERLQRKMEEIERNYEVIKQKLDSISGSNISIYYSITKVDLLPCPLSDKSVGLILSSQSYGKNKSSATRYNVVIARSSSQNYRNVYVVYLFYLIR